MGWGRLPRASGRGGAGSHVYSSGRVPVTHDPVLIRPVAIPRQDVLGDHSCFFDVLFFFFFTRNDKLTFKFKISFLFTNIEQ